MLTEAGKGMFHPTEHNYAKKVKVFVLSAIHSWSTNKLGTCHLLNKQILMDFIAIIFIQISYLILPVS